MTKRSTWWLPGAVALFVIVLLTGLPLCALLLSTNDLSLQQVVNNTYLKRVIWFSFYQALLSAVLSIVFAIPVALALSREQHFPGRRLLIHVFSMSLVIPTIVAIFGVVAVYGRTGWLNQLGGLFDFAPMSIYGLSGILIAHVFFNMPLAARVCLQALDQIPDEQWRLSTQLRLSARTQFRLIEWPVLRSQLTGLFMLIFSLCFTSFTIVMTLGGGPRATTIEVAIYQALRFDFDLNTAVVLALIQILFCGLLLLLSAFIKQQQPVGFGYQTPSALIRPRNSPRWLNTIIIVIATSFVVLPIIALLLSAINPASIRVLTHSNTIQASINTVLISLCAASLSVAMGVGLILSTRHLRIRLQKHTLGQWLQHGGNLILLMPPVVLGTGLFLLLREVADVFSIALVLATIINSLMALPFVLRILDGPLMQAALHHDRLIQSLGVSGWSRWQLLDWPLIKKPFAFAFAVSATLAAGDFSAIALFGSERALTLPLLLFQRMGSYRLQEAAVTAGLLLTVCFLLFVCIQALIWRKQHVETG